MPARVQITRQPLLRPFIYGGLGRDLKLVSFWRKDARNDVEPALRPPGGSLVRSNYCKFADRFLQPGRALTFRSITTGGDVGRLFFKTCDLVRKKVAGRTYEWTFAVESQRASAVNWSYRRIAKPWSRE